MSEVQGKRRQQPACAVSGSRWLRKQFDDYVMDADCSEGSRARRNDGKKGKRPQDRREL